MTDAIYLRIQYFLYTGHVLHLRSPQSFTEKLQWLKLYDRNPTYVELVDKSIVKDFVSNIIGADYIIPTIKIYDNLSDIDFEALPNRFVMKTTHGGGNTGVVICKDKKALDIHSTLRKLQSSLNNNIYSYFKEWPYKNVQRRILVEEFMVNTNENSDLTDYKVFCFNGQPEYIQVIQDRSSKETIDFFDKDWNHQPFVGLNPACENASICPSKPECLDEMLLIATKLSQNHAFLRVDLYVIDEKVYFGELTFYPGSGFGRFKPYDWDFKLGKLLILPQKNHK